MAVSVVAYSHGQQIGADDLLRGLAAPSRWLIHSGDYTSKRHSPLTQITPESVNACAMCSTSPECSGC